ncbi:MAG: glycosyltransferase family 1 protein [Dehalococcoidales bacterium]
MPTMLVTNELAGVDKYSQEIAKRLPVRQVKSRRYLSLGDAYRLAGLVTREPDVIHLPNQNFARYAVFRRRPFIVTVHDLIRFRFSFDRESLAERILLRVDMLALKRADHIIATSRHTAGDLVRHLGIPEERITPIYNGVNHGVFTPNSHRPLDEPYVLYVGSERPRKNLVRLLEAFAELKKELPNLKLVKVGPAGRRVRYRHATERIVERLGLQGEVTFHDYVPEEELAGFYRGAALLAYPSYYEGFGLPPLEAMCSGCPVVTSDTSSLPEVVGDAGILVSPHETGGWVRAMRRVLTDGQLREEMVRRGIERARDFSWDKAARATEEVYRKVAAG